MTRTKMVFLLLLLPMLCWLSLTGCSPARQIVRAEYVAPVIPDVPAVPEYWSVTWQAKGAGLWSLDERNAKNLLRNIELMKSYQTDMRVILEDLKDQSSR